MMSSCCIYFLSEYSCFRFGFMGNHPFLTLSLCSNSSSMLHSSDAPVRPRAAEAIVFSTKSALAMHAIQITNK